MRLRFLSSTICLLAVATTPLAAQFGFAERFTPAEFAARRAKVMDRIGNGVAVIHGSAEIPGSLVFRQGNQFYYLTGVAVPRAVLVIDGKARSSTLFLPARTPREQEVNGPLLIPGAATERITGIERVIARDSIMVELARLAAEKRPVFAPYTSDVRGASYVSHVEAYDKANAADPLDGRLSREKILIQKLQSMWRSQVRDLDSIVNPLRAIKSPAEIAAIREASRVAGLALIEVMRATKPGMYEHQLGAVADFVFRDNDAQGFGYGAIIATDTNAVWQHYRMGRSKLGANELVIMDYAPDIHYYTSDVTRQWPVSGKFTPRQREMYGVYLQLFMAVESSLQVGVPVRDILKNVVGKMERIVAQYRFTDPKIKAAAERMVDSYRKQRSLSFGHSVGMSVHDVPNPQSETLTPGTVFSIEPALTIPDEKVYIRIEQVYVVTERGVENISKEAPIDPDAIERLMGERVRP